MLSVLAEKSKMYKQEQKMNFKKKKKRKKTQQITRLKLKPMCIFISFNTNALKERKNTLMCTVMYVKSA